MRRALLLFAGALAAPSACRQSPPSEAPGASRQGHVLPPTEVSVPRPEPADAATAKAAGGPRPAPTASTPRPHPQPPDAPIPPAPPGIEPQLVAYLGSICGLATLQSNGKRTVGCRACPPYDSPEKWPDGRMVELTTQDSGYCALSAVYEGSFTRPGVRQVLLSMESPFMVDSVIERSAMVVAQDGARWRVVAYSLHTKSSESLVFRRDDGTQVLVGHDGFAAYYDGGLSWFYAIDFTKPPEKRSACFGKVAFNAFDFPCALFGHPAEMPPFLDPTVTDLDLRDTRLQDIDGDGTPEFVVVVGHVSQSPNKAMRDKVLAGCRAHDQVPRTSYLPALKEYSLAFRYDGKQFVPTMATHKLLEAWKLTAPERWYDYERCAGD